MLRKKKTLLDRAVDSASDAVDAARPVIESAVTQVRDLSKGKEQSTKNQEQNNAQTCNRRKLENVQDAQRLG